MTFVEVSAKTGSNIALAFDMLIKQIMRDPKNLSYRPMGSKLFSSKTSNYSSFLSVD